MLIVNHADHLISTDFKDNASSHSSRGSKARARTTGETFFSDEIARVEKRDGRLFSMIGNNREFGATTLKIEDTIRSIPLHEKKRFRVQSKKLSSKSSARQVGARIERQLSR